jgi:rRNA maturation RNase YbeY
VLKPTFKIDIRNETKGHRVSLTQLQLLAKKILKQLGFKKMGLNVLLVGDREIARFNQKFLNHKGPTDVISFSQIEGRSIKTQFPILGDIVISLDTTKRQAAEFGNSFDYELAFYLCHGILHLMGRSDATPKEARAMEKKQSLILSKIGFDKGHHVPKSPVTKKKTL